MAKPGILSLSHAKKFIEDQDSTDLRKFISIDDDAAEALGGSDVSMLYLDGLTSLSEKAAEVLAKFEGDLMLSLGRLTGLSDEVVEALRKFDA